MAASASRHRGNHLVDASVSVGQCNHFLRQGVPQAVVVVITASLVVVVVVTGQVE